MSIRTTPTRTPAREDGTMHTYTVPCYYCDETVKTDIPGAGKSICKPCARKFLVEQGFLK